MSSKRENTTTSEPMAKKVKSEDSPQPPEKVQKEEPEPVQKKAPVDTDVRKCFICNKEWFFLEKRHHGIGVCGDGEYEESSSDHSGSSYDPPASLFEGICRRCGEVMEEGWPEEHGRGICDLSDSSDEDEDY